MLNERDEGQPSICSVLLAWHYPWTRAELSTGQVRQVTKLGRCKELDLDFQAQQPHHLSQVYPIA